MLTIVELSTFIFPNRRSVDTVVLPKDAKGRNTDKVPSPNLKLLSMLMNSEKAIKLFSFLFSTKMLHAKEKETAHITQGSGSMEYCDAEIKGET